MYPIFRLFLLLPFLLSFNILANTNQVSTTSQDETHAKLLTKFNYFGKEQGLEQTTVAHIVEDKFGFIWLSTINSIYRFDGQEFKKFNSNNQLSNVFITTMLVTNDGTLWVGTESGLNKFDAKKEKFVQLDDEKLLNGYIWSLFEDNHNRLWVSTNSGLYISQPQVKNFELSKFKINNKVINLSEVKTIYQDINNLIWISTDRGSNYLINLINRDIYLLDGENSLGLKLPNRRINQIVSTANDKLLFIQDKEILQFFNNKITTLFKIDSNKTIKFVRAIIDKDNLLWVTSNQGVWTFLITEKQLIKQTNEEKNIEFLSVLYDTNNMLWFGSMQNGLVKHSYKSKFFNHLSSVNHNLKDDAVWDISEGENNEIWIAGNSPILTRFNTNNGLIKRFNSFLSGIKSLIIEKNNVAYIGAKDGLYQYVDAGIIKNIQINNSLPIRLIDFEVTYLTSDETYLYFSSWGKGLYRFSKKEDKEKRLESITFDSKPVPYITTLKVNNNRLYAGTLDGMYIFDLNNGLSRQVTRLKGERVSYINSDESGIYVSTSNSGVYLFDHEFSNLIHHYNQDEITERTVYSVLKDEKNNLWMSTNNGVLKVSEGSHIEHYDGSDGLQGDDFNDNSALKSSDGLLFFGGTKGLNFIDPNNLKENINLSPKLLFTNFTVFNNSIKINKNIDGNVILEESIVTASKITLKYSDYPFELTYNLVNHPQANKVSYRYKMNGLDLDWLSGKKNRTATYTNLDAGQYTFNVEAIDINTGDVIAKNNIKVIILPPLWLSNFAIFSYVILIISIIAAGISVIRERERSARKIRKVAKRLELSLWGSGDLMWDWNIKTNEVYHSEQWTEFDYDGLTDDSFVKIHPNDRKLVALRLKEHLEAKSDFFEANYRIKRHGNNEDWVWITDRAKVVSRSDDNKALRMTGTIHDITLLKNAQERLNLQANVMSNVSDAIYVLDLNFNIVDVNKAFLQITGLTIDDVLGNNKIFDTYPENIPNNIKQRLQKGLTWSGELKAVKPNGDYYQIELNVNTMLNDDHETSHYVAAFSDITQRKKTEAELRDLSNIDPLTKLPNRSYFQYAHRNLIRRKESHALLMMDIDNFKNINDSMGHDEGDKLLCMIAERIDSKIDCQHLLCRLGGDEFAVLLDDINVITQVLYEIESAMQTPFYLNSEMLVMSCSVGVAIYPNDGETTENMLQSADTAMYHAKSDTGFSYQFFSSSMNDTAVRRVKIESLIRQALKNDWFEVFYQPKIDLATQAIMGMEALVRLDHPEEGMIYPNEFIPIAEDTGLIIAIGEKVLDKACYATQQWRKSGLFNGRIAVNLAAKQFAQADLLQRIEHVLECTQLPLANLELEITESTVIENPELAIKTMEKLSSKGIHLSLDDFGTGYSSLSYLKRFPIHTLKIDKAFIDDLSNEKDDGNLVASIISIAKNMNLSVVAEGVEEKFQVAALMALNCETIQGYFYSKPLSEDDFTTYLLKSNLSKNYNHLNG